MKLRNIALIAGGLSLVSNVYAQEPNICEEIKKCETQEKSKSRKKHCTELYGGEGMCMQSNVADALGAEEFTVGHCLGAKDFKCYDTSDVEDLSGKIKMLGVGVIVNNQGIQFLLKRDIKHRKEYEALKQRVDGHDKDIKKLYHDRNTFGEAIQNNQDRIDELEEKVGNEFTLSAGAGFGFQNYTPGFLVGLEGCYNLSSIPGMGLCLNGSFFAGNSREDSTESSSGRMEDAGDGYTVDHHSKEIVTTSGKYFISSGLAVHQVILSNDNIEFDLGLNSSIYFGTESVTTRRTAGNQLNYNGQPLGELHNLSEEEIVDDIMVGVGVAGTAQICFNELIGPVDLCPKTKAGVLINAVDGEVSPLFGLGAALRY